MHEVVELQCDIIALLKFTLLLGYAYFYYRGLKVT